MWSSQRAALLLVASALGLPAAAGSSSFNATVKVDLSAGAPLSLLPHTWKRIFGSGHAALGLRADYQAQLAQAKRELGLAGVRSHGAFDDDMGPVVVAHRAYNFTLLRRLWAAQVALGLHPVVELSFMPSFLANCSWGPLAPPDCHAEDAGLPCATAFGGGRKCGAGACAYRGVTQLPTDFDDWRHLVQGAVAMAVSAFGLAEVQQWRFEVWNELWGMAGDLPGKAPSPPCDKPPCIGSVYMALYNASAVGVKAVHQSLQVGGPSTEHLNTQNFLSQAAAIGAPVDFVSSHNYPTGPRSDGSGCPQGSAQWVPQCFYDRVMAARAETADLPFLLTEYSVMVGEGMARADGRAGQSPAAGAAAAAGRAGEPPFQHDGPGAAAFIFRMVPQLAPHLEALSYWTFSDIFEENSLPRTEFHPIGVAYGQPHYGLMSLHGVPKPGWRAFQLLHAHAGSHTVPSVVTHGAGQSTGGNESLVAATTTVNVTLATAAAAASPGSGRVFLSHWDGTHDAYSHNAAAVTLEVVGAQVTSASASVHMIDNATSANLLWQDWGSPPVPTSAQIAELKTFSQVVPTLVPWEAGTDADTGTAVMRITMAMPPNSACVVEVV